MDANGTGPLRFGNYELDSRTGRLLRDGQPVKIQPQPLRVLGILVQRPGEIVTREELHARIWDNATFVEFDQGLIGIGAAVTRRPLPHHRAYGSVHGDSSRLR